MAKGQPLLILEAMKMQNEIRADQAGTVRSVFVAAGATVDKGEKLVEVETESSD
ncbi:MAG: acetyl-CoA carboxylase biotin carboxyl carrier protein subunit [Planctomycetota bacterium]